MPFIKERKPSMEIEIAYAASPSEQTLIPLTLSEACSAKTAIEKSGLLLLYPNIDLNKQAIGIFGRKISLDELIRDGDRIEIYRPLLQDPKTARKHRRY